MFGLLGAAFGVGQDFAGIGAARDTARVNDAENALNTRIADITASRVLRENLGLIGAQRNQFAAGGNSQYGSLALAAADDARRARERVTNVRLENARRILANSATNPSPSAAALDGLGGLFEFGAQAENIPGLFKFGK